MLRPDSMPPPRRRVLVALVGVVPVILLPACARPASSLEGISLEVHDGDSFAFRSADGARMRVRLSGIDAPEHDQPYAERSRRSLRELLRDARVRLEPVKRDVYDRLVARASTRRGDAPESDVALAQLRAGLAWHFTRYRDDQSAADFALYARAEQQARAARIGLWEDAVPEPPWAFRQRMRRRETDRAPGPPPAARPPAG